MKKGIFFLVTTLFFLVNISFSQVTVSLGIKNGQGSTNVLLSTSTTTNKYSRTMSIYSASEIIIGGGFAGIISKLAWDKNGTGEYQFNDAYIKILIKHTTLTAWSTSPVPVWDNEIIGATEVFTSSTYSIPTGTGWKEVVFTSPFTWNGTDNIAILVEWYRPSTPTGDIAWGRSTETNANASRVGSTSLAALVMLVNSNRPVVQLTISPNSVPITSLTVSTQDSILPIINTPSGTLQLVSTILPTNANQNVNWSIMPITGSATISTTGLVTAVANGTVWAKAVSVQDNTKKDSIFIMISNQLGQVASVTVSTLGSVPPIINTNGGTLQMLATILPSSVNQNVIWSIVPLSGSASISTTGLITAQSNGTVWAKAVSVQDLTKRDSMLVTITNQIVQINNLSVSTQGTVSPVINLNGGTLQMIATIIPSNANQNVNWSIVPVSGSASISTTGLVTAQGNGTVWAKAVSVQDNSKKDSMLITISNQIVQITSLTVATQGSIPPVIVVKNGTLQMVATILPTNASQSVNWNIIPVTGSATISTTGLITALANGGVYARAVSTQDLTKRDSLLISIANQDVGIEESSKNSYLKVYPNPSPSGIALIEIDENVFIKNSQILLFDINGKKILSADLDINILNLNISDLSSGIYILRYIDKFKKLDCKLVIE